MIGYICIVKTDVKCFVSLFLKKEEEIRQFFRSFLRFHWRFYGFIYKVETDQSKAN